MPDFNLLWGTGFELAGVGTNNPIVVSGDGMLAMSYVAGGVGGSYYWKMTTDSNTQRDKTATYTLPVAKSEIYAGFYIKEDSYATNDYQDMRYYVGANYFSVRWILSASGMNFYIVRDGTTLATSANYPSAVQHSVQVHYKVDDSVGVFEVRIDGIPTPAISYSGDTKPGAGTAVTSMVWFMHNQYTTCYLDNWYIGENDWGGALKFEALLLNGDSSIQWTPSTGAVNYALLDERPLSATDYVQSSTTDQKDLYTLGDFTGTDKLVKALVLHIVCLKTDAGTNDVAPLIKVGAGDEHEGTPLGVTVGQTEFYTVYPLNPDTGVAWTDEDLDSLLIGFKNIIT